MKQALKRNTGRPPAFFGGVSRSSPDEKSERRSACVSAGAYLRLRETDNIVSPRPELLSADSGGSTVEHGGSGIRFLASAASLTDPALQYSRVPSGTHTGDVLA